MLNASPLSLGLLTQPGAAAVAPRPAGYQGRLPPGRRALPAVAGADIAFLGMQFCFGEQRIPSTITGTAKKQELAVNLRALTEPIDRALLTDVQAILAPVKDQSWPSGNWKE